MNGTKTSLFMIVGSSIIRGGTVQVCTCSTLDWGDLTPNLSLPKRIKRYATAWISKVNTSKSVVYVIPRKLWCCEFILMIREGRKTHEGRVRNYHLNRVRVGSQCYHWSPYSTLVSEKKFNFWPAAGSTKIHFKIFILLNWINSVT